ncbi:G-protein coupled receptor 22-like [Actinia tenebrosa]|uniref:G-protein coupled receptor 22-like n=1 Tax=Actinia tenebrosa TaxID=6105 RepID=A0A6P8IA14_ACTTE|nr:G-protein coupled receptor 22-like [Actinia tenebrosa]
MDVNNTTMESYIIISNRFKIPLFCILVLELSVGFMSCASVIWIYWKKRHIRTAANFFITNLAVVDALISVFGISFTIARLGLFPLHSQLFCLSHEGITSALRNASVATLLLISYDRYESITNPFRLRINFKKAKRALFFLWLFAGISFTLPFIEYGVKKDNIHPLQSCVYFFSKTSSSYRIRLYYFPVFFIATIITLPCYWRISKAALSRIHHIQSIVVKTSLVIPMGPSLDRRRETTHLRQKEWKVAKMTGAIMCSVCILWFPYMIFTFILSFRTPNSTLAKLEYIFLVLGYLNCTLNPLLYAFTKQKFRNAFLRTLPKFGKWKNT